MVDLVSQLSGLPYVWTIQDSLGNNGASATVDISGTNRSATVTGTPTSSVVPPIYGPSAIVSLSPRAQSMLSDAQVALDVIGAMETGHGTPATAIPQSSQDAPVRSSGQEPAGQAESSVSASSVSDIVKSAASVLKDPTSTFYDYVNALGGPASFISYVCNAPEQQSFIDAFNNKTLNIQNASDIAGLDYKDSTVLTGTSETLNGSYSGKYISNRLANGNIASILMFPAVGGIYFSYPAPTTADGPAASTASTETS